MTAPDTWSETALVNVYDMTNATNMDIAAITETIDIDMGDKDGEAISTVKGGRLWKKTPQADTSITFEGYPISIGSSTDVTPDGLIQFFHHSGSDHVEPLSVTSSLTRAGFGVTIMWTDDTTCTTARGAVVEAANALRYDFQNCYFVSCKASYTDKVLKATWIFKCPAFNSAGTANLTTNSCDETAAMPGTGFATITSDAEIEE